MYDNGKVVKRNISGSGLFVAKTQGKLYIVTAAHVAKSMDFTSYIIIRGNNDMPRKIMIMDLIDTATPHWKYHNRADLAVLKLTPKRSILASGVLNQKFFSLNNISSDSVRSVSRDVQLTVIGFPLSLGIEKRFSPLTYRTYASSGFLTLPRADTQTYSEFIVLENPSVGGYSGGPVFDTSITVINSMTSTGEGTTCYGFMHGTLSDETGGKLAAVTPSFFLFDLIK
jgi:S1-C subfamily serine protease